MGNDVDPLTIRSQKVSLLYTKGGKIKDFLINFNNQEKF